MEEEVTLYGPNDPYQNRYEPSVTADNVVTPELVLINKNIQPFRCCWWELDEVVTSKKGQVVRKVIQAITTVCH